MFSSSSCYVSVCAHAFFFQPLLGCSDGLGASHTGGGDGNFLGGGDGGGPAARGRVAHAHHRVALHAQFSQFSAGRGGLNALSARPLSSLVSL